MFTLNITIGKRTLAWLLAGLLAATTIVVANHADAGGSPPGEGIARVYVAVGTGFADALGVGPGAAANGAPIILVPTNPPLDAATTAELVRLDPKEVVIVGGTVVISLATENALIALLPNATFSRIAGSNRYVTNADFSASVFPVEGWVSVPAGAFTTLNPDTDDATIGNNLAYNATGGSLRAQIQLPHGAEILELQIHAYDSDGGGTPLTVFLDRYGEFPGGFILMSVSTSGSPGDTTVATTTMNFAGMEIVDNELYAYTISVSNATDTTRLIRNVMVRYRLGVTG